MTTAMMILIMIFVLLTKMMAVRFDYDGGVDDDDDDVGGCWSRGEVPQAQCWSDQGLGRPHLLTQPPRTLQPPSIITLKHCHHQYLKSAKAININSNSKQRGFSSANDYSETFRTRRQELGGSVGVQPEENDVLDDCVTLFNVLALTATTI